MLLKTEDCDHLTTTVVCNVLIRQKVISLHLHKTLKNKILVSATFLNVYPHRRYSLLSVENLAHLLKKSKVTSFSNYLSFIRDIRVILTNAESLLLIAQYMQSLVFHEQGFTSLFAASLCFNASMNFFLCVRLSQAAIQQHLGVSGGEG